MRVLSLTGMYPPGAQGLEGRWESVSTRTRHLPTCKKLQTCRAASRPCSPLRKRDSTQRACHCRNFLRWMTLPTCPAPSSPASQLDHFQDSLHVNACAATPINIHPHRKRFTLRCTSYQLGVTCGGCWHRHCPLRKALSIRKAASPQPQTFIVQRTNTGQFMEPIQVPGFQNLFRYGPLP